MYFKQFVDERSGRASYLIASRQTGEAAVVDPAVETAPYTILLAERGFCLRYVLETHAHADRVSGARALAAAHGAELCLHESARAAYPFRALRDGEELALGPLRLRALHTPGHRPELVSLLVANSARSPEPALVLTGDALRPDFGGDAAAQHQSLTRLLRLPDWVAVFPGHVARPCGTAMEGRPSTTIGFERRFNPLARPGRGPFVAAFAARAGGPRILESEWAHAGGSYAT